MQRRTTIWFLLLFQSAVVLTQNQSELNECKIGSINPLAGTSLNACFKLYNTPKSYQAARKHCVSLGGQLAEKINKEDSSLYSANADLEVANYTKFWVGASNLKCNIKWENGGEIEYNDMWASDSRYYGVAIEKMSLGGLWHTVHVGQKLPFVCTFQKKTKEEAVSAPVHALRAPATKKQAQVDKAEESDIDDSLNAALADEKKKKEEKSEETQKAKKDEEEANKSINAAKADSKNAAASTKLSASSKKESNDKNEQSNAEKASMSAQQAMNASASMSASSSSSNSSKSDSSDETYSSAEIAMRKEIGKAVIAMKSEEMAAQSENYDKYTEDDFLSAAASMIGGSSVNENWADSSSSSNSTFDSQTDEESMSMSMSVADQMAMQSSVAEQESSSSSGSMSESSSDEQQASIAIAAAVQASQENSNKSQSSSMDQQEDSASMNMEQNEKASVQKTAAAALKAETKNQSDSKDKKEDVKAEEVAVQAAAGSDQKKKEVPKTTVKPPNTTGEPDIDESLNAALANQRTTTTKIPDLTTVITTVKASNTAGVVVGKSGEMVPGCPAEWTQFNANATGPAICFKRFEKAMNFEDARVFCISKGGHLASIHNERQLLLLSALLHNNGPDALSDQTWIGLNRIHQKYYVYEDETAMDFTRWLPGAPNINDCTVFTGNELPNYPHKRTQYKFGDFPCEESQKSVLCEVALGKDKIKSKPTCEDGWSYYSHDGTAKSGKCYKKIDQSKKFAEAREICKRDNSYVASVQNEGEARFVSALVQTEKNYTVDEQTWIGYVKYGKDFGWEDGSNGLQFDPWTEKMPREKKCTVFTGNEIHEDCRSQFRFATVDCNKPQRSILCSKPTMKDGKLFVYKPTDNSSKKI